jgi:hypothetical protein
LSAESPDGLADEKSMLGGWLDLYRDVMVMKIEGLDEEQASMRSRRASSRPPARTRCSRSSSI